LLLPLRRALRRADEHGAAAALGELSSETEDALEAMADALEQVGPLTVVLDDAHHLGDHATQLVDLVQQLPPQVRLVVTLRAFPHAAARLRTLPGVAYVAAEQLRFTPAEVAELLGGTVGASCDEALALHVSEATGGWPAAVTFVGEQLSRDPGSVVDVDIVSDFSSHVLRLVPPDLRDVAAQLAHLPIVDPDLAEAVGGGPEVLHALLAAGVPYVMDTAGSYRLPGAFADALARRAPLSPDVARRVAEVHLARAEPFDALSVLRRARAWDDVASTLVHLPASARPHLAADEITDIVDALPERTVRDHPWVLLELARALARAGVRDQHHDALDRADRLADGQPASYRRAVEMQRVADALFTDDFGEVETRAQEVVDAAGAGEEATIARGLVVLGTLQAWNGRRSEARRSLQRSAGMFVELGEPYEASRALVQLGFNVDLHDDLRAAERTFDEAVGLAGLDARARATALTYRGEARAWLGGLDAGERDLQAALDLARAARDSRAHAYATWGLALLASLRGDPVQTVAFVEETERRLRSWSDTGVGATFIATMTDLLDRAGAHDEADAMLARARARRNEQPELVALAEFVVAARRGDPTEVERLWPAIEADDGIEPFERVRCRFLRAYAALRGDDPALEQRYREAVTHAETIELPDLPANLEPAAATALADWAARRSHTWTVQCFGPLRATRDGELVALPPGRPSALVGWLALTGEAQRVARLIDVLWPDATEASGRARLRQVLYRLRQVAPGLVVRLPGDRLGLGPDVVSDLGSFDRDVDAAMSQGADALTAGERVASRTAQPLLPDLDDLGADGDLDTLRAEVRNRCRAMAAQLIAVADQQEDRDAALRWARYAHDLDPLDEPATLRLARRLVTAGRDDDARTLIGSHLTLRAQVGLDTTPALAEVRDRLQVASTRS
jgi:DNA-binding SARP family transcriptional activator